MSLPLKYMIHFITDNTIIVTEQATITPNGLFSDKKPLLRASDR